MAVPTDGMPALLHRVDDQGAVLVRGHLHAGLGTGPDQRVEVSLHQVLYLRHRHPRDFADREPPAGRFR